MSEGGERSEILRGISFHCSRANLASLRFARRRRSKKSKSPEKVDSGAEGSEKKNKKGSFFSRIRRSSSESWVPTSPSFREDDRDLELVGEEVEDGRASPMEERLREARRGMREAEERASRLMYGGQEIEEGEEDEEEGGDDRNHEMNVIEEGRRGPRTTRRTDTIGRLGSLATDFNRPNAILIPPNQQMRTPDATGRSKRGSLDILANAEDKFKHTQEELRREMINFVVESPTEEGRVVFEDWDFEEEVRREARLTFEGGYSIQEIEEEEEEVETTTTMTFEVPTTTLVSENLSRVEGSPSSEEESGNGGKKLKTKKSSWFSRKKEKKEKEPMSDKKKEKKSWFSRRKKGRKKVPEDASVAESSVLDFDEISLPSTASPSPPESPTTPPTVAMKVLDGSGSWGMTVQDSLYISHTQLEAFIDQCEEATLGKLTSERLASLTLQNCDVVDVGWLGDEIEEEEELLWHNLTRLQVSGCGLEYCHSTLSHLQNLRHIDLSDNNLIDIPRFETPFLENLILHKNRITSVTRVDHLTLVYLDLSNNMISSFSSCREIVTLKDCLRELHLEGNRVASLGGYRSKICSMLENLKSLDGTRIASGYTPTKVKPRMTKRSPKTFGKSGRTNIKKLERFMHDSDSDLAKFLTDIAKAKALAKDRLRDEKVRKEAIDMVYKLRRNERNTNAYLGRGGPPKLPCEMDGSLIEEEEDGGGAGGHPEASGYSSPGGGGGGDGGGEGYLKGEAVCVVRGGARVERNAQGLDERREVQANLLIVNLFRPTLRSSQQPRRLEKRLASLPRLERTGRWTSLCSTHHRAYRTT